MSYLSKIWAWIKSLPWPHALLTVALIAGYHGIANFRDPAPTPPAPPVPTPLIDVPSEVSVDVGRLASIIATCKGEVTWSVPPDVAASLDTDICKDRIHVVPRKDGEFYLSVSTVDGARVSLLWVKVKAGKGPLPPPPPIPVPPGPTPQPPPIPATGLRVLIVYETSLKTKGLAKEVADYLNAKCVVVNKQPEWRRFDKDTPMAAESQIWKDAMARPRLSIPWVVISDGTKGFEGPWPEEKADQLALLRKYGG